MGNDVVAIAVVAGLAVLLLVAFGLIRRRGDARREVGRSGSSNATGGVVTSYLIGGAVYVDDERDAGGGASDHGGAGGDSGGGWGGFGGDGGGGGGDGGGGS